MSLMHIPLESIDESDLQALVDNQVSESKSIEYKESLLHFSLGNQDESKKKFLAAISSFANAAGGDLILGIKEGEQAGIPVELCGLDIADFVAEETRLVNMIRAGIDPRITVVIQSVRLKSSKTVVILRVRQSWNPPHMVTFRGHDKFYARDSTGKHPLDVSELRTIFELSGTTGERIRQFRVDRVSKIISGETAELDDSPKTILHIVPLSAFSSTTRVDLRSFHSDQELENSLVFTWVNDPVIPRSTRKTRYNFDGYFASNKLIASSSSYSYVQFFHSGIIEAVDTRLLMEEHFEGTRYDSGLVNKLTHFLDLQKQLGVEPPFFVMVGLLGVSGRRIIHKSQLGNFEIDKEYLLIQETVVNSFQDDSPEIMKPILDAIWNAAGWPQSQSYDDNGKWIGST